MLYLASKIKNLPVGSLQSEHRIGTVKDYVLDPRNLKLIAFKVESAKKDSAKYLYVDDILAIRPQGVLINHNDQIMSPEGLVRLKDVLSLKFKLEGKKVVTTNGKKLGKATDFAFDVSQFLVQKLYVKQSVFKGLSDAELIISRSQIESVDNEYIKVKETQERVKNQATTPIKKLLFGSAKPQGSKVIPEPTPSQLTDSI